MSTVLAPHVLIVDDDQTFARTLARLLGENGYETATLSNADSLFEYLATRPVDLLILDLSLPGKDGFAVLEELRKDPAHATLPILVLSSAALEEASVKALGLGASDFVGKPLRLRELLARIRARLRAGRELNQARAEIRAQAALVELLREITTNLSPRELYQVLVRRVASSLRIPRCSILLGRPGAERVTVVAASENPMLRDLSVDLTRYPEIRRSLETGEVVLVRDTRADPVFQELQDVSTTSALVLPFSLRGERAGVFFLRTGEGDAPLGDADLRFAAQVAQSAVSAIENSLDLEESSRREEAVRQLVETDPLTGLLNRRALGEKLQREIERAGRFGTVLTCVMVDIDEGEATGGRREQPPGDRILVQFAELLRREQRTVDVLARYEGEQFVVLLPETGSSGARLFADRILRRVGLTTFGEAGTPMPISVNLGLATFPDERAGDGEALVRLAGRNLQQAKSDGRNRYRD
jgi:two-component system cell cycle response regulator